MLQLGAAEGVIPRGLFGINAGWEDMAAGLMVDGDVISDRSFRKWEDEDRNPWTVTAASPGRATHVTTGGTQPPGRVSYPGYLSITAVTGDSPLLGQRLLTHVRAGQALTVELSARASAGAPLLSLSLVQNSPYLLNSNVEYAAPASGAFVHSTFTLTALQDLETAYLYVSVFGEGTVDLDEVRLLSEPPSGPRRVDAALVTRMQELGVTGVLWPGGFAADHLEFTSTVGPVRARPEMDTDLHAPQTPAFGLGEMLELCERQGWTPYLQFNVFADAEEAVLMAQYLRGDGTTGGGALRAMHGRALPYDVMFLQLGNEPSLVYGALSYANGGADYAALAAPMLAAIRAVDPAFQVSVLVEAGFQQAPYLAAVPLLGRWNAGALGAPSTLATAAQGVAGHYYAVQGHVPDEEVAFATVMAAGAVLERTLASVRTHSGALPFHLTEFHVAFQQPSGPPDDVRLRDARAGLGVADLLFTLVKGDVAMAHVFNLSERVGFGLMTHPLAWTPRPAGLAFTLFSTLAGRQRHAAVLSPAPDTLTVDAVGNLPEGVGYERLSAVAATDNGRTTVVLINRHPNQARTVALPAALVGHATTLLHATDFMANNEGPTPQVVLESATVPANGVVVVPGASVLRVTPP